MKEKTYKDTSLFSGVAQYFDESGQEWRRMKNGGGWNFYKLDDNCFILDGYMHKPQGNRKIKTVKEIHKNYIQQEEQLN